MTLAILAEAMRPRVPFRVVETNCPLTSNQYRARPSSLDMSPAYNADRRIAWKVSFVVVVLFGVF
jgi:hypothetical protein